MLSWLLDNADSLGLTRPGVAILELGSGTGWMGINLAAQLPKAKVTLSEQPHACDALREQVERTVREVSVATNVSVMALQWETVTSEDVCEEWDYVLGSELLYSLDGLHALPHAMRVLLLRSPHTKCFYAHMPGRNALVDQRLHETFHETGLSLREAQHKEGGHHPIKTPEGLLTWCCCSRRDGKRAGSSLDAVHEIVAQHDEDEDEWIPDGGLFATEDDEARALLPAAGFRIFHVELRHELLALS